MDFQDIRVSPDLSASLSQSADVIGAPGINRAASLSVKITERKTARFDRDQKSR
jgi:hypothetical protein